MSENRIMFISDKLAACYRNGSKRFLDTIFLLQNRLKPDPGYEINDLC